MHTLQKRSNWYSVERQKLKIGYLVLIKEDNLPPLCWILGRIEETGNDEVVRAATVKSAKGQFKRTIIKLADRFVDN